MKKQSPLKRIFAIRGMGGALTAFAGLIIIYIAFGIINPAVFSGQNVMNLLRSMSKYLIIGIGQSYVLITGNIDLSIGSVVGMSAMIAATLMTMGVNPVVAILITFVCCMIIGVLNGILVGKWKLPPFIATLGTMFVARGVAYMVNGNRNTDAIASGVGKMPERLSRMFSTMVKHWAFTILSGLQLLSLSYSSFCCPKHVPADIFMPSVPMWMQQSCPASA